MRLQFFFIFFPLFLGLLKVFFLDFLGLFGIFGDFLVDGRECSRLFSLLLLFFIG